MKLIYYGSNEDRHQIRRLCQSIVMESGAEFVFCDDVKQFEQGLRASPLSRTIVLVVIRDMHDICMLESFRMHLADLKLIFILPARNGELLKKSLRFYPRYFYFEGENEGVLQHMLLYYFKKQP